MEAPDGKLNKVLKDETLNVIMYMTFINDNIYNKDENVIDNEACIFE